jgi:hypothetical protein
VLDGEIVCLDRHGKTQFKDLLFRRGESRRHDEVAPVDAASSRSHSYAASMTFFFSERVQQGYHLSYISQ